MSTGFPQGRKTDRQTDGQIERQKVVQNVDRISETQLDRQTGR